MIWTATKHLPGHMPMIDVLGLIPHFMDEDDPRPAAAQIRDGYIGGWSPAKGFTLMPESHALVYPGDPDLLPMCESALRDERIFVYACGWTLILQPCGSFEVSRLD